MGPTASTELQLSVWINSLSYNIYKAQYIDERNRKVNIEYDYVDSQEEIPTRRFSTENFRNDSYAATIRYKNIELDEEVRISFSIPSKYYRVK